MRDKRGFTIAELIIVIVIIGLVSVIGVPRLADAFTRQSVRNATNTIVSMHAKAKATAVSRGMRSFLILSANEAWVVAQNPVTGAFEFVVPRFNFDDRFSVTVTSTRAGLSFDPRGVGLEPDGTMIIVSRGAYADTIQVSSIGRVLK